MPEVIKGYGNPEILAEHGWNILNEEVSFPVAVLSEKAINNNAKWMANFCHSAKVNLAPHGKTSMAPALFKTQLEQGAWGITLATVPQVLNAVEQGIKRIILANQLVGKFHFEQIAQMLKNTDVEFYCFVDSVANAKALGEFFQSRNVTLNILLELGVPNGRCGWRDLANVNEFTHCISHYPCLKLAGIGFYEGVIYGDNAALRVAEFVNSVFTLAQSLKADNAFSTAQPIITGAGSAWYDVVATTLSNADLENQFNLIVRPGCYLIHDTGIYQDAQQGVLARSQLACDIEGGLESSLFVWAYVMSTPEPGLAIIGLGKRDSAFDAGLPTPEFVYSVANKQLVAANKGMKVTKIMDQHCMLEMENSTSLNIGDLVCFSTSHPCLTFDKWREIAVADDNWVIRKTISTYF